MELKFDIADMAKVILISFNRTFMELKFTRIVTIKFPDMRF